MRDLHRLSIALDDACMPAYNIEEMEATRGYVRRQKPIDKCYTRYKMHEYYPTECICLLTLF